MNDVERMQGEIAALSRRMKQIEIAFKSRLDFCRDEKEAAELAAELGFSVEVLYVPANHRHRAQLGRALADRGWSAARIARAFNTTERTVERWVNNR